MCVGKGRGNGIESLAARQEGLVSQKCWVFSAQICCACKGNAPRLAKYASEVLPLLPLALPAWPTNCCGVKDKLLRPRNEVESLGCWRDEVLSAALCQQRALLSINQVFLLLPLSLCCAFLLSWYCRKPPPFSALHSHLPAQRASLQQHPSSSSHSSSPAALGVGCAEEKPRDTYVSRLLQNPPIPGWRVGDSAGGGRARGGWHLHEFSNQCCATACSSSGIAACRDEHDGRAQPWCKDNRPGLFAVHL